MAFFLLCVEIARQAAQMKLMRKLEKQALARAAKEARKQQGELKFFVCVLLTRVHGCKDLSGGFSVRQSVTSDHFDLNGCSIKTSRASGDTHAAYIALACMYVHIYFHHFKAQALLFFLL